MGYAVKIYKRALNDIQKALSYYDHIDTGIADKFQAKVNKIIDTIASNPFYEVRYKDVHCLIIPKSPYMLHFQINEKKNIVIIRALVNTSKNPDTSWIK